MNWKSSFIRNPQNKNLFDDFNNFLDDIGGLNWNN